MRAPLQTPGMKGWKIRKPNTALAHAQRLARFAGFPPPPRSLAQRPLVPSAAPAAAWTGASLRVLPGVLSSWPNLLRPPPAHNPPTPQLCLRGQVGKGSSAGRLASIFKNVNFSCTSCWALPPPPHPVATLSCFGWDGLAGRSAGREGAFMERRLTFPAILNSIPSRRRVSFCLHSLAFFSVHCWKAECAYIPQGCSISVFHEPHFQFQLCQGHNGHINIIFMVIYLTI